jgi:hypothetical protein
MGLPTVDNPNGLNLSATDCSAQGEGNTTTAGAVEKLELNRVTKGPTAKVKQATSNDSSNNMNFAIHFETQHQPFGYAHNLVPISYGHPIPQLEPHQEQHHRAYRRFKSPAGKIQNVRLPKLN